MSLQDDIRASMAVPSLFANLFTITVASSGIVRVAFGEAHSDVAARYTVAVSLQMEQAESLMDLMRRVIDEHAAQMHPNKGA